MVGNRLKTGEKFWVEKLDDEYIVLRFREHGPWCNGGCTAEGGCCAIFADDDIVGGTVQDVCEHPEQFGVRYFNGEPLEIQRLSIEKE